MNYPNKHAIQIVTTIHKGNYNSLLSVPYYMCHMSQMGLTLLGVSHLRQISKSSSLRTSGVSHLRQVSEVQQSQLCTSGRSQKSSSLSFAPQAALEVQLVLQLSVSTSGRSWKSSSQRTSGILHLSYLYTCVTCLNWA